MKEINFKDIDYFYDSDNSDGFTYICFYDSSKYDETEAFGNELAIYPATGCINEPDFNFNTYYKWMEEDKIVKIIY